MLETIQRKLGKMTETKRENWTVNFAIGGSTVKLIYETSFALGKGTETLTIGSPAERRAMVQHHLEEPVVR